MYRLLYKTWFKLSKTTKSHLLFWLVFIIWEVVVSVAITSGSYKPFYYYILFYILNISTFYCHSLFLLKRLSKNTVADLWWIPLLTILEMAAYCFVTLIITWTLCGWNYDKFLITVQGNKYTAIILWRGTYFILFGTGYYILLNYNEKKEKTMTQAVENEKLKNEVLRAEQDFLRAQINPHLLFNTLSFIKYAARKKPEEADEAVMRLSSIMSFALDNNNQSILLVREIDQVENIIGLNQLRFNHTLHIIFNNYLDNEDATIIPIILLTLVENVFKHGNLLDKNHPAEINVAATKEHITLKTRNITSHNNTIKSHNTGLNNIRSRLEQFYKGNYHFHYEQDKDIFKVDIKILL